MESMGELYLFSVFTDRVVCINHADALCSCIPSRHCLRYRHTLNDLLSLLSRLKDNIASFSGWLARVKTASTVNDTALKPGLLPVHCVSKNAHILIFLITRSNVNWFISGTQCIYSGWPLVLKTLSVTSLLHRALSWVAVSIFFQLYF